jgi:hypothetical protein
MGLARVSVLALCSCVIALAQEPPLPEGNAYVRSIIGGGRPQDAAINDYAYDREETREDLDDNGRPTSRESRRFEVYFVRTRPVRRLVARNGLPLSPKEQAEVDRKAKALAQAIADGKTVSEQPGLRLAGLLDRFDFKAVGREQRFGRSTLAFAFEPRKDSPSQASSGAVSPEVARILTGRVYIDEADRRVARLEARSAPGQKASVATGVTLNAFELVMEYAAVENGVWLPRRVETVASGRAFFFKTFRVRRTTAYSNFRKFKVETEERPIG